jgi:hypothetical protein
VATTQRQHQPNSAPSGTVPVEAVFETEDAH